MVHELIYIIIAVFLISLISLIGVLTLFFQKKIINKLLIIFVAFAAGSLLGVAFFDLIPESFEKLGNLNFVLIGIILFFLTEAFIHWHHHHEGKECKTCLHPYVYLNLIGDGLHNFLDGVIIAASFLINIPTGIATSIAIVFHEIPQELGDFAVLVHGGLRKSKAILFNFLSALFAVLGGILGYVFLSKIENFIPYIVALAAGGFIYIATSDLFPELHKERDYRKIITQILALILGILVIVFLFSF